MTPDARRAIEWDVTRLINHYVNLNDAQDWKGVSALYTQDARFARPSQPGVFIEGRSAILASFLARPARVQRHLIANIVVDVEDADTARAISVIVLYMGDAADDGGLPVRDPKGPLIGTFTDLCLRTAEGWRFKQRVGGLDFQP